MVVIEVDEVSSGLGVDVVNVGGVSGHEGSDLHVVFIDRRPSKTHILVAL